jgi:hypothetical protein
MAAQSRLHIKSAHYRRKLNVDTPSADLQIPFRDDERLGVVSFTQIVLSGGGKLKEKIILTLFSFSLVAG